MYIKTPPIPTRRRGAAMVYIVVIITALMGVCSLSVDLGRYHTAHQEMYNAAVAAARAGAAKIYNGTASSVSTAALSVATSNYLDGQTISSSNVTVEYLNWVSSSNYTVESTANFSHANAVRVTITYNVPLVFAQVLGIKTKTAVEQSVALVNVETDTPTVFATGDIWLANEPAGTQGSQADPNYAGLHVNQDHQYPYDIAGTPGTNAGGATSYSAGQPYSSPIKVAFNVIPGATIMISNTSGIVSYDYDTSPFVDATGNSGGSGNAHNAKADNIAEHGISDVTMPLGAMNAVFTGTGVPDNIATVPPPLDFSTQAERDYVGLQPKLQQSFYVGTGLNSSNEQQQVVVPQGATYLYLGIMDGWEWDNNTGSFSCTVTQMYITTVQ